MKKEQFRRLGLLNFKFATEIISENEKIERQSLIVLHSELSKKYNVENISILEYESILNGTHNEYLERQKEEELKSKIALNQSLIKSADEQRKNQFRINLTDFQKLSTEVGYYNALSNRKYYDEEGNELYDNGSIEKYEELRMKQLDMFEMILNQYDQIFTLLK
jgi:hypothetical protein